MAYQYKDVTQYKRKGRNRKQLEYFKEDIIGRYKLGTSIMDIALIYDVSFNTIKNNLAKWGVYIVNRHCKRSDLGRKRGAKLKHKE